MEIKKDILWRVYLCFLCMVLLTVCVLARAVYIQKAEGAYWLGMSDSLHLKYLPVAAERGSIYSEDGDLLSTSVPIFDIYVDFGADGLREKEGARFKDNVDSLSYCLANLFGDKSKADYKKQLQLAYKNKERYFSLKKKISFDQFQQLRSFPLVRLGRNKSGFIVDPRDKRINPYVLLANRTIGLSRPNPKQNVGLELTYDSILRGTSGQRLMRYSTGAYIPVEGSETDPVNGKDIITTLDTYMQDVAEGALMDMMVGNNSLHGTAIIMETATGKIKAIANLGKQADGTYIEDLNYGIGKATEPGSVFKLATLISLMEDGYVDNNTLVDCGNGTATFHGLTIRDSHRGTGTISVLKAFYTSSNVAFAKLAYDHYSANPKQFTDHLNKLRLDQQTGVDIIASSGRPTIKTKEKNRSFGATTIAYMAHGYEELVTPLHMLMLYNAVANNGTMMRPYLVSAIRNFGVDEKLIAPEIVVPQICSKETLAAIKLCLRAVVDSAHGTAHKICYDSTYSISGKTGTAVTALDNRGYNKGNKIYQSSFIGFFPSEKPVYSMAVVIQNSNQSKLFYGADVAGSVFKSIADKVYAHYLNNNVLLQRSVADTGMRTAVGTRDDIFSIAKYLKINKTDSNGNAFWQRIQLRQNEMQTKLAAASNTKSKIVPAVSGMGLKDAVYMLENNGLRVKINGRGKVVSQSPLPGNPFSKGQTITLWLN